MPAGVVTALWENRESCANHERYRHCKRGGVRIWRKPVIGEIPEKAMRKPVKRKSGELLERILPQGLQVQRPVCLLRKNGRGIPVGCRVFVCKGELL